MRLSVLHHLILATGIFTFILIGGIVAVSHVAVINGIEKTEKEAAPQTAEKILAVLSLEEDNLARIAYDWGVWDETYEFMENKSDQYISSNLAIPSLVGIQVNEILFFGSDGTYFYGVSADYRNESSRPIPKDLVRYLNESGLLESDTVGSGIVPLPGGPVLIATHPILMSNERGTSRGTILFGRDLDEARIAYLSAYALYPFHLERIGEISEGYNDNTLQYTPATLNTTGNTIITSGIVRDISGNPSYIARMEIPYNSPYTREVTGVMIILVIILSALFFVVILLYYRYFLARHISDLSDMLDKAVHTTTSAEVLSGDAPPEINRLATSVSRVTRSLRQNRDDLHRSREVLEEAEERWQIIFEEATDAMCVGDEEGIINANRSWTRLFGRERAEVVSLPIKDLALPLLDDGTDPMVSLVNRYYSTPDDSSVRFDWRVPGHDGGELVFDVTIKRIRYKGELLRFVVARDISVQVRLQKEQEIALTRIDKNLVQLGTLNDEIRNPLTIICGLIDDDPSPHKDGILLQVNKIDAIIDKLDRGYLDSEKVRNYLKRSFELGKR